MVKLVPTIKVVIGYMRICLIDVERNSFVLVPKEYLPDLESLECGVENKNIEIINQNLLRFLTEMEFLLFVDQANPILNASSGYYNLEYYNCTISDFVLEISNYTLPYLKVIFDQLNFLQTKYIVIYYYHMDSIEKLEELFNYFNNSNIHCIDVYLEVINQFRSSEFNTFLIKYSRLNNLLVFDNKNYLVIDKKPKFNISSNPLSVKFCGVISKDYWVSNFYAISEALFHNSCLHKKLSIDFAGNIKNCPSMKESFGNIKDTTLAEAIEKPGFKKYWDINKDQIAVCKDCEFRYICTDCRAYVEEPNDASGPDGTNLSKPLKCGYNPYTGEWTEWSTNPLKQMAIDYYGMREMVESTKG